MVIKGLLKLSAERLPIFSVMVNVNTTVVTEQLELFVS